MSTFGSAPQRESFSSRLMGSHIPCQTVPFDPSFGGRRSRLFLNSASLTLRAASARFLWALTVAESSLLGGHISNVKDVIVCTALTVLIFTNFMHGAGICQIVDRFTVFSGPAPSVAVVRHGACTPTCCSSKAAGGH